ncbi:hypothetical protein QJQ45_016670 [Haematococcus lacustris]|nr:hypothetical protein QJQ45_016670 [Haematococcus lacustris]
MWCPSATWRLPSGVLPSTTTSQSSRSACQEHPSHNLTMRRSLQG